MFCKSMFDKHSYSRYLLLYKYLSAYEKSYRLDSNNILSNLNRIMTRNLALTKVSENHSGLSNNIIKCWKWNVNKILNVQENKKYAILILNCRITQKKDIIKQFWNEASLRITVDGGTSHWDKFLNHLSHDEQKSMKCPDLVTGDFDSISEEMLQKYKDKHCKIISTPDQDFTDFTKAIIELNNYCEENKVQMDYALVMAQNSGRLDQILGNIQTLHLIKENRLLHPQTRVYMLSDDSISWLLHPGDHIIEIPLASRNGNAWCSLIPVGEPCISVTTSGLKWNLDNQKLNFGGLISTSNTFDGSDQVKVKCSHTLLWSMEIPTLM
ncbi:thiamin pyrophosphokinase 1 isoform X2 [Danaus plexippus]|uniref:thiamin pyrophosphokinase 1 isoform X2 n=1 Tax=Danaus plexippus TaxID=13037 RepID=UPI002AAFADEE|nr:thiamin pyrophosphokinase 1 isoform X2 [Danaus plexippus]